MSTPLEIKLYDALKRIASYEKPERLYRNAEKDYGISGEEAVEYAYDNVLHEAKQAIKGVRAGRLDSSTAVGKGGLLAETRGKLRTAEAELGRLRAELEWYGEQARLARLIHSGGDSGRHALAADGGRRARAALSPSTGDAK